MPRKEPELRLLHGQRESDDDGFTYRYGRHKAGSIKRTRHNNGIARCRRADKRAARQAALQREARELD